MSIIELILIAIALSMDAFAVAVTSGIVAEKHTARQVVRLGLFFGGFQFLMPVIGWFLVSRVSGYIEAVDHWIAFGLLAFIGVRMIIGAVKHKDDDAPPRDPFSYKTLLIMAIATSIDALAVGASFALTEVNIWTSCAVIGVITFGLSVLGVFIGKKVGQLFQKRAEIVGGAILVAIGVKILIEHLIA